MYYVTDDGDEFHSDDIKKVKERAQELADRKQRPVEIQQTLFKVEPRPKKDKEIWIPALVRYQANPPHWWMLSEEKVLLMGTVILVKKASQAELNQHSIENGVMYKSARKSKKSTSGNWWWASKDLILWPSYNDYILQHSVMSCVENGMNKRRPLE